MKGCTFWNTSQDEPSVTKIIFYCIRGNDLFLMIIIKDFFLNFSNILIQGRSDSYEVSILNHNFYNFTCQFFGSFFLIKGSRTFED